MRLGCGVVIGALLLGVLILGGAWFVSNRRASEKLAIQVAKVRARGEPLTTVELNDFYRPAENRPDMTHEILTALALCQDDGLNPLAASLPFVGQGQNPPTVPEPWAQLADAKAYLARLKQPIAIFHEVARRDGTARFPVDFSPGVGTLLNQTQSLRLGPRILTLQFHVDLHQGNFPDAVECILTQIALARVLDREPTLVSQLVQLALANSAIANIQALVRQADLSDGDLERLQLGLRKFDFQPSLKCALAGERTFGYMACVDPNRMTGESAAVTAAEARQIAQRTPQRVQDATRILDFSLRISEAADESLSAALRESERVEADLKSLSAGMINKILYGLTLQTTPAYIRALTAFIRSTAKRDCGDAALACERYRRQHGTWPESLAQLVPEFLPTVPIDQFSEQPLKMIVSSDEIKIYSVGLDGIDDLGALSDDQQPHTDIGIAVPARSGAKP